MKIFSGYDAGMAFEIALALVIFVFGVSVGRANIRLPSPSVRHLPVYDEEDVERSAGYLDRYYVRRLESEQNQA